MAESPFERMRSDRWQIIGISLGILVTFLFLGHVDGIWRYVYLFLGGAIGALCGIILRKLLKR